MAARGARAAEVGRWAGGARRRRDAVASAMREFKSGYESARLVDGFLILALGNRICDQPGPGLYRSQPFLYYQSANGDAGIAIAGEIELENGSSVDAAARRLALVGASH